MCQFFNIEDSGGFRDTGDIKYLCQLLQRKYLLLCVFTPGTPAKKGHIVQNGLREIALGLQILIGGIAVALGHLVVGVPHNGRAVNVGGNLPAKGLVEQIILGGAAEVLAATDHVGDAHEVVIDDVGEVVGRQTVPLNEDLVVQSVVIYGDVAENGIVEGGGSGGGDLLPDDIGLPGRYPGLGFSGIQIPARIGGTVEVAAVLLALRLFAEAVIGMSLFHQQFCIAAVGVTTLRLDIGSHRTSYIRTLVVVQTTLRHGAVDHIGGALHQAALVGVLDAQDKSTAGIAGDKPGIQGGAEVAHMHVASGGGSKAGTDLAVRDFCLHLRKICHIKSHSKYPP